MPCKSFKLEMFLHYHKKVFTLHRNFNVGVEFGYQLHKLWSNIVYYLNTIFALLRFMIISLFYTVLTLFTLFNTSHFTGHLLNLWRNNCFALINIASSVVTKQTAFFITNVSFSPLFCTFLFYCLYIFILKNCYLHFKIK